MSSSLEKWRREKKRKEKHGELTFEPQPNRMRKSLHSVNTSPPEMDHVNVAVQNKAHRQHAEWAEKKSQIGETPSLKRRLAFIAISSCKRNREHTLSFYFFWFVSGRDQRLKSFVSSGIFFLFPITSTHAEKTIKQWKKLLVLWHFGCMYLSRW